MQYYLKFISLIFLGIPFFIEAQNSIVNPVLLPNGWTLTPAGRSLPLGDLPLNIAVSLSKN